MAGFLKGLLIFAGSWAASSWAIYWLGMNGHADTHNNCMAGAGLAWMAILSPILGAPGGVLGLLVAWLAGKIGPRI